MSSTEHTRPHERRRSTGWERVLRRLLPSAFRKGWGGEILELLRAEQAAARRRGALSLLRYRLETLVDLARAGWQMRPRRPAGWRSDLRFGVRGLRRSPGFVVASVLTLGLGTSVSAGMFSLLEHTLVQPLPVERPDELLRVHTLLPPDAERYGIAPVDLVALDEATTLSNITFHLPSRLDADVLLRTDAGLERVSGLRVAPDHFELLGVAPLIGPGFDTGAEAPPEVMLGHRAWTARYGGDPAVVGRTIEVDGRPHAVVGVLPAGFDLPYEGMRPDFLIARHLLPREGDAVDSLYFTATARLAPGASPSQALAEIEAIGRRAAAERAGSLGNRRLTAVPLTAALVEGWTTPLTLLGIAALVVLLMACSSVALLMLARQTGRDRELGLWIALGARPGSVARRLLVELLIVAAAGVALGLLLARWGAVVLLSLVPTSVPRFDGVTIDASLVAFAGASLVVTTLLGGLAPLLRLRSFDLAASLKGTGPGSSGAGGSSTLTTIAGVQAALMAAMLVAVGLTLASFVRLRAVDPGFRPEARFAVEVTAPQGGYGAGGDQLARETRFFTEVVDRLRGLPDVRSAGLVSNLPLTEGWGGTLYVEDAPPDESEAPVLAWEVAGPGYFEAAGIPIVRGRGFAAGDTAEAPEVVVVNEALAERFFPERDPIGLSISGESNTGPWRRVVGIVGNVRQQELGAPAAPQMYIAQAQAYPFGKYQVVLTTAADASVDTARVREVVRAVDADGVAGPVRPLEGLIDASVAGQRLATALIALFSGLTTLLAVTGTWGVVSLVGRSRAREWGVRSALGAGRAQVVAAAARAGGLPIVIGLAAGFTAAALGTRWLAHHVYGLSAWEPGVFAGVLITLVGLAAAAIAVPAWRAASVDPAAVFRDS